MREIETQIAKLEGRQREIASELEKPETYERGGGVMELNRELQAVNSELERITADWEKLADPSQTGSGGINAAVSDS